MAEESIEPLASAPVTVRDVVAPKPSVAVPVQAIGDQADEQPVPPAAPPFGATLARALPIRLTLATLVGLFVAALLLILLVVALASLANVLLVFFLGVTIALGLVPAVQRLMSRGLSRGRSTLFVYLGLVGILLLGLWFILSPFIQELAALSQQGPQLLNRAYDRLPVELQERIDPVIAASQAASATPVPTAPAGVITSTTAVGGATITSTTSVSTSAGQEEPQTGLGALLADVDLSPALENLVRGIVSGILALIFALIISAYWIMADDKPQRVFLTILPAHHRDYSASVLAEMAKNLGAYLRGELFLALVIGVASYIGLTLIGTPFALALAVLAGVMEMVPTVGPLISEIPAIIIAFAAGGLAMAFWVFILYTIIQNVEGAYLVPRVMGKAVSVPGLVVLLAVSAWGVLFGFLGALLAVPITAVLVGLFRRMLLPYLQHRAAAVRAADVL